MIHLTGFLLINGFCYIENVSGWFIYTAVSMVMLFLYCNFISVSSEKVTAFGIYYLLKKSDGINVREIKKIEFHKAIGSKITFTEISFYNNSGQLIKRVGPQFYKFESRRAIDYFNKIGIETSIPSSP